MTLSSNDVLQSNEIFSFESFVSYDKQIANNRTWLPQCIVTLQFGFGRVLHLIIMKYLCRIVLPELMLRNKKNLFEFLADKKLIFANAIFL